MVERDYMIGDYDYTPSLRTVLIWVAILLLFGALLAIFGPQDLGEYLSTADV